LVDEIQRLKRSGEPTEHLEREIEKRLYEMYGLTAYEIAEVEKNL